MILLASEYLLFELSNGECIPYSAENVTSLLAGKGWNQVDREYLEQMVKAVFHYFRHEQARDTVTAEEFSRAMEQVIRQYCSQPEGAGPVIPPGWTPPADLRLLAEAAGRAELLFFPELRRALHLQLQRSPNRVEFHGLRGCVKRLAGARRWCPRCAVLRDRIMDYLRACLRQAAPGQCLLVVD